MANPTSRVPLESYKTRLGNGGQSRYFCKAKEQVIPSFITCNTAAHVSWNKQAQRTCATTLLILHLGLSRLWKAKSYCPKTQN
jgi:hypothetical protein